jgi:hypothetical protein
MGRLALVFGAASLAALCVAIASTRAAGVTEHSPIRPPGAWRWLLVAGLVGALVLYGAGSALLARFDGPLLPVLALAVAIQLTPLAAPLLLSTDVYAYWTYGRIQAVHDGNPYVDRPIEFRHDPAFRLLGADWREKPSVYGPSFTVASAAGSAVAGDSASASRWFFRGLASLGALGVLAGLAARARRRAFAVAFVGWNPLLALHFAGGGHNDVLMAALMVPGVALAPGAAAGMAWTGAISVKVVPLVFVPLWAIAHRRWLRTAITGFALAAAAVAAVAVPLYGSAWLRIFSPVANQLRQTSSLGLPYWLSRLGVPQNAARDALALLFVLGYLWLLREAWQGRARLALAAAFLLLATSWLQPWYAVWLVPLAALEEDRLAQGLALGLTAYFLRDALPV